MEKDRCPACGSRKTYKDNEKFSCSNCGYINKSNKLIEKENEE